MCSGPANLGPTYACNYPASIQKSHTQGQYTIPSSEYMLAGAGMPKPLTGAGLIQNLLQIAVGESEVKGKRKERTHD